MIYKSKKIQKKLLKKREQKKREIEISKKRQDKYFTNYTDDNTSLNIYSDDMIYTSSQNIDETNNHIIILKFKNIPNIIINLNYKPVSFYFNTIINYVCSNKETNYYELDYKVFINIINEYSKPHKILLFSESDYFSDFDPFSNFKSPNEMLEYYKKIYEVFEK